jgi:hypothetical protein
VKKIKLFIVGKFRSFTNYIGHFTRSKTPESNAYFEIIKYLSKNAVSKNIDITDFLKNNFIWEDSPHGLLTTMQHNRHISFVYGYDVSQNQNTQASITIDGMSFYSSIVTNESVITTNKMSRTTFIVQTFLLIITTCTSIATWLTFVKTTNNASLKIYQEPSKISPQLQTDKSKTQLQKPIQPKRELKEQK